MKKQLLSIFAVIAAGTAMAQSPSPSWTIAQNPNFTLSVPGAGTRFMDAVDNNVAWVCGYDGNNASLNYNWFSRTTNGGNTWVSGNMFSDTNTYILSNMEAIDANTAWVATFMHATGGEGAIHRTTNGGASWTNMSAPGMFTNTATSFCNFVTFLTTSVGVVNGDPIQNGPNLEFEIWRTLDGGTTWTMVPGANIPDPVSGEFAIVDMYSTLGPNHVWYGTNKGRVFRSTDAGQTWSVSQVGPTTPTSSVIEVRFATPNNGLCYVISGTNQMLYNTTNGGATWNLIPGGLPANFGANEMCAIPGTPYFASVDNAGFMLSYSLDNGVTWNNWGSSGIRYLTIDFASMGVAWVGGFNGIPSPTVMPGIFKYNGGGQEFQSMFSIPPYLCISGGSATLSPVNSSTATTGPLTYFWASNPPTIGFSSNTATTPVMTFTANGTYTITLSATSAAGTGTSSQVITVGTCSTPVSGFTMASNVGCNNVGIALTNTSTGIPNPTITITTNPANNVTVTNTSGNFYQVKFGDPGTYTVILTATNPAGTSTSSQVVTINNCVPVLNFSVAGEFCRVRDTLVTTNMSSGIQTHTWSISPSSGVGLFQTVNTNTTTITNKKIVFNSTSTLTAYVITLKATNQSGTATVSQTVNVTTNCTGIEENSLANLLSIYPNPTRDKFSITLPSTSDTYNVKVVNVLGDVVYSANADKVNGNTITVSLASYPKGVYFITVENKSEKATRKIVLE